MDVGIIDYGAGNLTSVIKAVDNLGFDAELVSTPEAISKAERLILPGVGASKRAMENLNHSGLVEPLNEAVLQSGTPLLGICVGMQLMAEDLYEFGPHKGLGWIKGKVISLQDHGIKNRPVPHMGWSEASFTSAMEPLSKRLARHTSFYFAHSYTLVADEKDKVCSTMSYGGVEMVAGLRFDNVAAFQFHPEKSQISGEYLLEWFMEWEP